MLFRSDAAVGEERGAFAIKLHGDSDDKTYGHDDDKAAECAYEIKDALDDAILVARKVVLEAQKHVSPFEDALEPDVRYGRAREVGNEDDVPRKGLDAADELYLLFRAEASANNDNILRVFRLEHLSERYRAVAFGESEADAAQAIAAALVNETYEAERRSALPNEDNWNLEEAADIELVT